MYKSYPWFFIICLLMLTGTAYSQGDSSRACNQCCCSTDPTPSGVMISHVHQKHQWMLSYRYMSMNMSGMQQGTEKINNDQVFQNYLMSSDRMRMDMHMLMLMYGVSNRLTLMGMVNYNVISMNMSMLPGMTMNMPGMTMMSGSDMDMSIKSSGLGDVKITALYGLINQPNHHLLLSGGLSLPVGSIDVQGGSNSMYAGQRIPYNMQLGSGTWDILPGINYLYQKNNITFSSQITSVIRTGYNNVGYKLGNEVTFNNWFAYQWSRKFSSSVRLEGYAADAIHGADLTLYSGYEPAANPVNYGGQKVSGFVGTNFYFRKGILNNNKIGAEFGVPFYQNLNGIQMNTKSSLYVSWAIMF